MRSVALVTQKGGSGKSTLSASLAVEAQASGEMVFLIDMDPQGSLATWAGSRADTGLGVEAVSAHKLDAVLAALAKRGVTLAIIDTPAGLTIASEAAMRAADLVAIPVRPTVFDIWASEATFRRARELDREAVFVLSQCPIVQGSRRFKENAGVLEAMGGLLQPPVTGRVDYQDAILRGLGPTEYNPTGVAAEEIRALWVSMRRRLARVRLNREAALAAA